MIYKNADEETYPFRSPAGARYGVLLGNRKAGKEKECCKWYCERRHFVSDDDLVGGGVRGKKKKKKKVRRSNG